MIESILLYTACLTSFSHLLVIGWKLCVWVLRGVILGLSWQISHIWNETSSKNSPYINRAHTYYATLYNYFNELPFKSGIFVVRFSICTKYLRFRDKLFSYEYAIVTLQGFTKPLLVDTKGIWRVMHIHPYNFTQWSEKKHEGISVNVRIWGF